MGPMWRILGHLLVEMEYLPQNKLSRLPYIVLLKCFSFTIAGFLKIICKWSMQMFQIVPSKHSLLL